MKILLERPDVMANEALLSQLASRSLNLSFVANASMQQGGLTPAVETDGSARFNSRRALLVLFHLLPLLPTEITSFYLSSVHGLVQPSAANADACADACCVEVLIEWLSRLCADGDRGGPTNPQPVDEGDANDDGTVQSTALEDAVHEAEEYRGLVASIIALIEAVGSHRLLVGEAYALLALVRRHTPAESPQQLWLRLQLCAALATMLDAPMPSTNSSMALCESFILLRDGDDKALTAGGSGGNDARSGIRLRCGALPSGKSAFSFALWLLLRSPPPSDASRCLATLRLPCEQGTSLRVVLTARAASSPRSGSLSARLTLSLDVWSDGPSDGSTNGSTNLGDVEVSLNSWHMFTLTHTRGAGGFGMRLSDDEASLFVDGAVLRTVPLKLPPGRRNLAVPSCSVGAEALIAAGSDGFDPFDATVPTTPAIAAGVRSAYMFAGALGAADVAALHAAGPVPALAMHSMHAAQPEELIEAALPTNVAERLYGRLIGCMHAELLAAAVPANPSFAPPHTRTRQEGGALPAVGASPAVSVLHGSAALLRQSHATAAILALGGANASMLPLLSSLTAEAFEAYANDPCGPTASIDAAAAAEAEASRSADLAAKGTSDATLTSRVDIDSMTEAERSPSDLLPRLRLLRRTFAATLKCLRCTAAASMAFDVDVGCVGALLASAPTLLSADAAMQVLLLARQSVGTASTWMTWRSLLLDWSVWIYAPASVQALVLDRVASMTSELATLLPPQLLLDSTRQYAWTAREPLSAATDGFGSDEVGFTIAVRPKGAALSLLRTQMHHIVARVVLSTETSLHSVDSPMIRAHACAAGASRVLALAVECEDGDLVASALAEMVEALPTASATSRLLLWRSHCAGSVALYALARLHPSLSAAAASLVAMLLPARDAPALQALTEVPEDASVEVVEAPRQAATTGAPWTPRQHISSVMDGGLRQRSLSVMDGVRKAASTVSSIAAQPRTSLVSEAARRSSLAGVISSNKSGIVGRGAGLPAVALSLLGPKPASAPPQPPRQVVLCHTLRCLLQLDGNSGAVAAALEVPVDELSRAARRAQSCEYLGASGIEPFALHSADVFWSLLLLHCCVAKAPSDESPPHRDAAIALLGEVGGSLLAEHCMGAVSRWPGGDMWAAWLFGSLTCTWEQVDSIDDPVDPPLAQRIALSPECLATLGRALALSCAAALPATDGGKRWQEALLVAKALDAALPPSAKQEPRGTLTMGFVVAMLESTDVGVIARVGEVHQESLGGAVDVGDDSDGGTEEAADHGHWLNLCELLSTTLDLVRSGDVAHAALQGGNDSADLMAQLVKALAPLAGEWRFLSLRLSLHCSPVFEAPLEILAHALVELALSQTRASDEGYAVALAAASLRSMLGGVQSWTGGTGGDVLEMRTVQIILLRVLRSLLAVPCPEHAPVNEDDDHVGSLLHLVVQMLLRCIGDEEGVDGVAAIFDMLPSTSSTSASPEETTGPAAAEDVRASRAAWRGLRRFGLRRACAAHAESWLLRIAQLTRGADAAQAALAEELTTSHRSRNARLLAELEAVRAEERRGWVGVQTQVEAWVAPLAKVESIRWSDAVATAEERTRRSERTLRKQVRKLKAQRGPWGAAPEADEGVNWKLNKVEDGARRRRRLRRNPAFDSHEEASVEGRADEAKASLYELTAKPGGSAIGMSEERDDGEGEPTDVAAAPRKRASLAARLRLTTPGVDDASSASTALLHAAAARLNVGSSDGKEEPPIFAARAALVKQLRVVPGLFALTKTSLHFLPTSEQLLDGARERAWPLTRLSEVLPRRYLLQLRALELFFGGGGGGFSSVLFSFDGANERHAAQKALLALPLSGLLPHHSRKAEEPSALLRPDPTAWTRLWQMGALSNFEYLMRLNTLAGRTYSDLTQYPVMPWVLSDFASDAIDLADPTHYRDLASPIGALNVANHARLDSSYETLKTMCEEVDDINAAPPPFHFGSHYSSMGVVLFFLIRMEPFTTQQLLLQGGRFDHADRLFHSIADTWDHLVEAGNTSDVKELVPEMYYLPEFLSNHNGFNFGTRQDGERLGDVVLPPWAHGSPHLFVRTMRAALESDHVSAHLHHWIDLIFGVKQQGTSAIAARNVFHHLTYEGAIDVSTLRGHDREIAIAQIREFGQTPSQLFAIGHAPRGRGTPGLPMQLGAPPTTASVTVQLAAAPNGVPVVGVWVVSNGDRLLTLDATLMLRWFTLRRCTTADIEGATDLAAEQGVHGSGEMAPALQILMSTSQHPLRLRWRAAQLPALLPWAAVTGDGDNLYVCGAWINGLHVHSQLNMAAKVGRLSVAAGQSAAASFTAAANLVGSSSGSVQPAPPAHPLSALLTTTSVACVCVGSDGHTVLAGCSNGTSMLWRHGGRDQPMMLCGHTAGVTSVALQVELALAISGSEDGTAMLFDTQAGAQIRSLIHPSRSPVHSLCVSGEGEVLLYSADDGTAHVFSINGEHLGSAGFHDGRVRAILASQSAAPGFFVIAEESSITVRRSHDLSLCAQVVDAGGVIACASLYEVAPARGRLDVILGFESGTVATWVVDVSHAFI